MSNSAALRRCQVDPDRCHGGANYSRTGHQRSRPGRRGPLAGRLDDLTFHDLRHTGQTLAAQTGATLADLMKRLGHSSMAAARRYLHAVDGRDREIAKGCRNSPHTVMSHGCPGTSRCRASRTVIARWPSAVL
ncbi:tyrosine-type recombinase/integrase [Micromonospora sp. NPDC005215]|uniref:tyrosine-type recombinase/integrase n=1 Tax=Micromonospora sp. NPDC005215 TaxID=3157024 RepID=UPI0033A8B600